MSVGFFIVFLSLYTYPEEFKACCSLDSSELLLQIELLEFILLFFIIHNYK
jgi:hypothetical protein